MRLHRMLGSVNDDLAGRKTNWSTQLRTFTVAKDLRIYFLLQTVLLSFVKGEMTIEVTGIATPRDVSLDVLIPVSGISAPGDVSLGVLLPI